MTVPTSRTSTWRSRARWSVLALSLIGVVLIARAATGHDEPVGPDGRPHLHQVHLKKGKFGEIVKRTIRVQDPCYLEEALFVTVCAERISTESPTVPDPTAPVFLMARAYATPDGTSYCGFADPWASDPGAVECDILGQTVYTLPSMRKRVCSAPLVTMDARAQCSAQVIDLPGRIAGVDPDTGPMTRGVYLWGAGVFDDVIVNVTVHPMEVTWGESAEDGTNRTHGVWACPGNAGRGSVLFFACGPNDGWKSRNSEEWIGHGCPYLHQVVRVSSGVDVGSVRLSIDTNGHALVTWREVGESAVSSCTIETPLPGGYDYVLRFSGGAQVR